MTLLQEAEGWDEIEFVVESGAITTVTAAGDVKAVKASDPDPSRTYRLADGSLIQYGRRLVFNALTEDHQITNPNARVTDAEKPLLSVSLVVAGGSEVVFSPLVATSPAPEVRISPSSCRA